MRHFVFWGSLVCLAISLLNTYNISVFIDEHNLHTSQVFGGGVGLALNWIYLLLLGLVCLFAGLDLLMLLKSLPAE